jgi:tricarballylate dehydrogenase
MADLTKKYDVLVVGGGNAALCAAIAAQRAGASVLVLEAATKFYRGGNTRHTRNMRCAHDAATKELTGRTPRRSSSTTSCASPAATPTSRSPGT